MGLKSANVLKSAGSFLRLSLKRLRLSPAILEMRLRERSRVGAVQQMLAAAGGADICDGRLVEAVMAASFPPAGMIHPSHELYTELQAALRSFGEA